MFRWTAYTGLLLTQSYSNREVEMAFKLTIVEKDLGIIANVKYENMSRMERTPITAKADNGKIVSEKTVYRGTVLNKGDTNKMWCDDEGNFYEKSQIRFYDGEDEVSEVQKTETFEITGYEPVQNYTDRYVIDKFYELFPSNNDAKKDYDRDIAIRANRTQMKKLWDKLMNEGVVGRASFNVSSRGFYESDGYVRAVSIEGKWGLEVGVFKEQKVFEHLNEVGAEKEVALAPVVRTTKRLKAI